MPAFAQGQAFEPCIPSSFPQEESEQNGIIFSFWNAIYWKKEQGTLPFSPAWGAHTSALAIAQWRTRILKRQPAGLGSFVNQGCQADAGAEATLGKTGLEAQAKFTNGTASHQISDTGIMLGVNLTGTKYWKSAELNSIK
jgi:hypothetical protein